MGKVNPKNKSPVDTLKLKLRKVINPYANKRIKTRAVTKLNKEASINFYQVSKHRTSTADFSPSSLEEEVFANGANPDRTQIIPGRPGRRPTSRPLLSSTRDHLEEETLAALSDGNIDDVTDIVYNSSSPDAFLTVGETEIDRQNICHSADEMK